MPDLDLTIAAEPFESADVQGLITALDAALAAIYPPEQRFGPNLRAAQVEGGQGVFLVARRSGSPIACGGIRLLDPRSAELKRMFCVAEQRGRGVGRALLTRLEDEARSLGVSRLKLETGVHQEAAIALYRRAGFEAVECWGEYRSSPTSVCFEKHLGPPAGGPSS